MEKDKICSFFGHRTIKSTETLSEIITAEIVKALEFGCRTFYFGGYGDFDKLCYQIVSKIKRTNPTLNIERVYCVAQESFLHKKVRYFERTDYEKVIYLTPAFEGWYKSIYFRNCAMIDNSEVIIFYAEKRENSGAYKAFMYAKKKKGKRIVNLFENR